MTANPSTARSRELGHGLRVARREAGFTGTDMAEMLKWPQSRLSRIETGKSPVTGIEVAQMLAASGIIGPDAQPLIELASEPDEGCRALLNDELADQLNRLTVSESKAMIIEGYDPVFIPGLMQTESYARAVFHEAGHVTEDEIEPLVRARMDRKRIFDGTDPTQLRVFIHEHMFRIVVGSRGIMHKQLMQLGWMCHIGHVTVQVVPESAGARGIVLAPFRLMTFDEDPPLVCAEIFNASVFIEETAAVQGYRDVLNRLASVALTAEESEEVIAHWANMYI